jgi:hypothetical protein
MASEVIFYSTTISQAISDNTDLLDRLFAFLDCPFPVDPSCTGYFRKVVLVMLQRATPTLTDYVRTARTVSRFASAISMHCAMELLIVIGWDSGTGQIHDPSWLLDTGLVGLLLAALTPTPEALPDAAAHAARTLVDLIVKCPDSSVVAVLHQRAAASQLVALALADHPAAATRALTVLVVLAQRDICLRAHAHAQTQRRNGQQPPPASALGESPLAELVARHVDRLLDIAAGPAQTLAQGEAFVWPELPTTGPVPAVPVPGAMPGDARLKALELLGVALRAATPAFCESFCAHQGFQRVLAAALARPWHSLLHALVETCVCAALRSRAVTLARALVLDADVVGWVLHTARCAAKCAAEGRHGRPGVMAYTRRLAGIVARVVGTEDTYAPVREAVPAERWAALCRVVDEGARPAQLQLYRALRIKLASRPEAGQSRGSELGLDDDDESDDVYARATQLARQDADGDGLLSAAGGAGAGTRSAAGSGAEGEGEDEDEDDEGDGTAYARRMLTRVSMGEDEDGDVAFERSVEQRESEVQRNRAALRAMLAGVRHMQLGEEDEADADEEVEAEEDGHEDGFVDASESGEEDDDGWPFGNTGEDLGFNTFDFSSFTSNK